MLVAFGVVFFLLAKFGFPIIVRTLADRKKFVDSSLEQAHEIEQRIAGLDEECRQRHQDAERERKQILTEAAQEKEAILEKAREDASREASKIIEEAKQRAQSEKEAILDEAKDQIVELSIAISEKILRSKLKDEDAQIGLAKQLVKEIKEQRQ